jgi:hypothetical protein
MGALTAPGMLSPVCGAAIKERVTIHRNLEEWRRLGRWPDGRASLEPRPESTLAVRREYELLPVNVDEVNVSPRADHFEAPVRCWTST